MYTYLRKNLLLYTLAIFIDSCTKKIHVTTGNIIEQYNTRTRYKITISNLDTFTIEQPRHWNRVIIRSLAHLRGEEKKGHVITAST